VRGKRDRLVAHQTNAIFTSQNWPEPEKVAVNKVFTKYHIYSVQAGHALTVWPALANQFKNPKA